jgi:hypothetical protein
MTDYRVLTRSAATGASIDADRFERQIGVESVQFAIDVIECRRDSPAGARGIAQLMPVHWSAVNPCDPSAALAYAANLMAGYIRTYGDWFHALIAYNWGSGNLVKWMVAGSNWADLPGETQRYIDIILGDSAVPEPVYDPTTPIVPQNHDWDCAEQSTLWAMTAYGRHPSDSWMETSMIQGGVESTDLGLLVADGSKLAAWITEQYGEFGYHAYNNGSVGFDDVASVAGRSPVLIGGRNWGPGGHWVGVRRFDASSGWLELANPANGYAGVGQTLTRQQFDALGPFSMVAVQWGSAQPAPPPAPVPAPAAPVVASGPFAGMTLEQLQAKAEGLLTATAYLGDNLGDSLTALAKEAHRVRVESVGPRPT